MRVTVEGHDSTLELTITRSTARTVNQGLIRPDAFSPPLPLLFKATIPRYFGRARRRRDLVRHLNSPSRARTARLCLGVHYFPR